MRRGALGVLALSGAVVLFAACRPAPVSARPPANVDPAQARPAAPEFPSGLQWLNTDRPLALKELRGKVVVIDFWTYCCINCMHIIPDLKKLEAKYPKELVVIGVHSAKFNNEKDTENIRQAIRRYEIEHPVINDKDLAVWQLYGASSWPTVLLIDPDGNVVGAKAGEGIYEPFDQAISAVIKEFDAKGKINRQPLKLSLEKDRASKSALSYPGKIAADGKGGRLFVTDSNNNRVVILSLAGAVQEIIGSGHRALADGDYKTAEFFRPQGICYDAARNALYIADTENHAIRKIDLVAKTVTTLAGTGKQASQYPPQAGFGKSVALSSPWDVLQMGRTLYVAMAGSHQIWTLNLDTLAASSFSGSGREDILDGPLREAAHAQPSGLTTDGDNLYVADSEVSAVRKVSILKRSVSTLIGKGLFEFGDVDGKYPSARLQHPIGIAWHNGSLYVADTYNHKIKRLDPKTRTLETVIGSGSRGAADGPANRGGLNEPNGLVFVGGKAYITDTNNNAIRVWDPSATSISTLRISIPATIAEK